MAAVRSCRRKNSEEEKSNISSKSNCVRKSIFGDIDKTKEYIIYWICDSSLLPVTADGQVPEIKQRGISDYLLRIFNIDDIYKTNYLNLFIILDEITLSQHLTTLEKYDKVREIYVFGSVNGNKINRDEPDLFLTSKKIRGPFNVINDLFHILSRNVRTMIDQPTLINEVPCLISASKTTERSTSSGYTYITDWYIYLMHALQDVPPASTCKQAFVSECSIFYNENSNILKAVSDFNESYVPQDAIRWYTRDGFLYKTLNRVLRQRNQKAINLLHFFIYDIVQSLKTEFKRTNQGWMRNDTVRLYRGQLMSIEEIKQLCKSKGELLFVNSFLSMTKDYKVAKIFSGAGNFSPNEPIQSVIFQVEWGDSSPTQSVADIHHLSYNCDEGEILLSPTNTLNLIDCVYDEKERVWNVLFVRPQPTDNPSIRIMDDECLIKLELILRHLSEKMESINDTQRESSEMSFEVESGDFKCSRQFCSIFVKEVLVLLTELQLPDLCSVTLSEDNSDRYHLKTLASFTTESLDHEPNIHNDMVVTLYDALGSAFQINGQLMKAYYFYQKASAYDKPQTKAFYTRQAHLAQIHKINGDYDIAWNLFDELMILSNDEDGFLYEDIAFARHKNMSDEEILKSSHAFIEYCSKYYLNDVSDDESDGSESFTDDKISAITDAWAMLGYKYFYQNHNIEQALICYEREKELSVGSADTWPSNFNPLIGSCSERTADVFAFKAETRKALSLYNKALELYKQGTFVHDLASVARCMCKIGLNNPTHQSEIFHRSFQLLINGCDKPYIRDTIGKCFMYFSRSLLRSARYEEALKYAEEALSIFQPDPLLLERLIDECVTLVTELHKRIDGNCINIPTHIQVLSTRQFVSDEKVKRMLETAIQDIQHELSNKINQ